MQNAQFSRKLDFESRKQDLLEAKFGSSQKEIARVNKAVNKLAGVTDIRQMDAKTFATIAPSSLGSFFTSVNKLNAGDTQGVPTKDMKNYMVMEKQKEDLGLNSIFETPFYEFLEGKVGSKGGEKSDQEIRSAIVAAKNRGIDADTWQRLSVEEKTAIVEADLAVIKGADKVKKVKTGSSLADRTIEQLQSRKRQQKLDSIFGVSRQSQ